MPEPKTINLVDQDGIARAVPESEAQYHLDRGWHVETPEENTQRLSSEVERDIYGGAAGTTLAAGAGLARGITGGLSDAAIAAMGGGEKLRKLREINPGTSIATEIAGGVSGMGIGGLAERAGARVAGTGGGALSEIARTGVQAGTEGGILGLGQGVSQVALSDDPVTVERAASVIGSSALFGAATGGALGVAGKTAEIGLTAAKARLDKLAAKGIEGAGEVGQDFSDLTKLDRKGLRAAEKTETTAIEAARVPKRAEIADEVQALRSEMKDQKIWLATKDADVKAIKEVREVGKVALEADRSIDRMLRNPKALAERPQRVLDGLQQQESALEKLVAQGDNLRPIFAKDASGARQAALDYASTALEKNRALQAKIAAVVGKPTSPRLEAIQDAMAGLGQATKKESATVGDVLGQAAIGHAVGALAGIPYLGQAVLAAKAVGGIAKKLGADTAQAAARGSKAIETFLSVGKKVAPTARLAATKTLLSVRYGTPAAEEPAEKPSRKQSSLADAYQARSAEIRNLTAPGPDGKPVMRMDERAKMAERLAPIRAADPLLADRIETNKARAVEFLADKLPKKPDLPGMISDKWHPSDMQMRGWARYVAAVEDPHGVVERLADGSVTPEDAEVMREVYPEMYAQIQSEIMMQMGELRAKLPFARRLALSIFSGVPVDPTLDPRVLSVLQGAYAKEAGTEGGIQAPVAQPAFGSVSKEKPTAAQDRGA